MKFIDHLRNNPNVFDGETEKFDHDLGPLDDVVSFDVAEIADQIIQRVTLRGNVLCITLTENADQLLKLVPIDGTKKRLDQSQYMGIIPPFERVCFEFPASKYGDIALDYAMLIDAIDLEQIPPALDLPDGCVHGMHVTVLAHLRVNGNHHAARETVALILSGAEGELLELRMKACIPPGEDPTLPQNQPKIAQVLVTLLSLMMLNTKLLKSELTPEPVLSRQQRRWNARHPERAPKPAVRYHILKIDPSKLPSDQHDSGRGGWEMAWHMVRGHLRRYKSGKVVAVRPHSRGNALKGMVLKDYELKAS
jgi:hypothetical protein